MLAMLLEMTSTLVCCACIPVPAISKERMRLVLCSNESSSCGAGSGGSRLGELGGGHCGVGGLRAGESGVAAGPVRCLAAAACRLPIAGDRFRPGPSH